MLQIGLAYLLPFILIFILFGNIGKKYNQKTGTRIFLALLIFFGIQIISISAITVVILARSKKINPADTVSQYAYQIHIFSFVLAGLVVYYYYIKTQRNFIKNHNATKNEIEKLGEK